jgi:hypothetical protein
LGNQSAVLIELTTTTPTLNVWTYPEGNVLRRLVEKVVIGNKAFSPNAIIVPGPGEMIEKIRQNSDSIGYIPRSWLKDGITVVALDPSIQANLQQPILALAKNDHDVLINNYIACLQEQ